MKNFTAHTDEIRKEMLSSVGCESLEDLFKQIPVKIEEFKFADPLSEMEAQKRVKALAKKNKTEYINFMGGGVYNKFIPQYFY